MKLHIIMILRILTLFFALEIRANPSNHIRRRDDDNDRELLTIMTQEPLNTASTPTFSPALPLQCRYIPDQFITEVIITMNGNPDLLTDGDIRTVQRIFVESYNNIAGGLCDEFFRYVEEVLQVGSGIILSRRKRSRFLLERTSFRRFSFRFYVLGICRGCPRRSRVFDEAYRRLQTFTGQGFTFTFPTQPNPLPQRGQNPNIQSGGRPFRNNGPSAIASTGTIQTNRNPSSNSLANFFVNNNRPRDLPKIFVMNRASFSSPTSPPTPAPTREPTPAPVFSPTAVQLSCDCLDNPTSTRRPPGQREFQAAYNATIARLNAEGILANVGEIVGVQELEEAECASELSSFVSQVIMGVAGTPDSINQQELDDLVELFLEVYRVNAQDFCDPFFRQLLNITVAVEEDGEANNIGTFGTSFVSSDGGGRERSLFTTTVGFDRQRYRPFQFRFTVRGTCRGCGDISRIFDDGFRRRVLYQEDEFLNQFLHRDLNILQRDNRDDCVCAVGAAERVPDVTTFTQSFRSAIRAAQVENPTNNFPNIDQIEQTIQVDETEPSASPTTIPSLVPSDSPSTRPSGQPSSDMPSNQPSGRPSESIMPSDGPSDVPTRPTIPTESPVPSPSPSTVPSQIS